MRPYAAVQTVIDASDKAKRRIAGSCFRLWSTKHFITANHVVMGLENQNIQVLNYATDADFSCINVTRHPVADIAVIEIDEEPPVHMDSFRLSDREFLYGMPIHSFGVVSDLLASKDKNPFRVIGGILQRDFIYSDGRYTSSAVEISSPIPKGHSGAPAFIATSPDQVIGVSIATIQSELMLKMINEYKDTEVYEIEKISEYTRYGVVALLGPIRDWLESIIGNSKA